jgi:hypothetical protein
METLLQQDSLLIPAGYNLKKPPIHPAVLTTIPIKEN